MKQVFGVLFLLAATLVASAQEYKPVDAGSSVTFEIKNMGFNSSGSFTGLEGKILFDPKNPASASFNVSISAASVNTDNNMRDEHLKKESYFDVTKYPRIQFVSEKISGPDKNGHYTITGKLTIKNTTKEISFPFIATSMGDDYIFKGDFSINRKDFDIGGTSTLSNNVNLHLTILAKKQ